jgi:hypothetical protein
VGSLQQKKQLCNESASTSILKDWRENDCWSKKKTATIDYLLKMTEESSVFPTVVKVVNSLKCTLPALPLDAVSHEQYFSILPTFVHTS